MFFKEKKNDPGQNIREKVNNFNKSKKWLYRDLPRGTVVKNPPASAGDMGLIPAPGRFNMLRSN